MQVDVNLKKAKFMVKRSNLPRVFGETTKRRMSKQTLRQLASGDCKLVIDLNDYPEVMRTLMDDKQYAEYSDLKEEYDTAKNRRKKAARMGWETRKYTNRPMGQS